MRRLKPATGLLKIQPKGCNAKKTTTTIPGISITTSLNHLPPPASVIAGWLLPLSMSPPSPLVQVRGHRKSSGFVGARIEATCAFAGIFTT
jgi:hypothetical protein